MERTFWFKSFVLLFENPSRTEKSDHIISAFIKLLNMMLVSIVDYDKTLLALELWCHCWTTCTTWSTCKRLRRLLRGGPRTTATSKVSCNFPAVNYYNKELHLGCCSSPRSTSSFFSWIRLCWSCQWYFMPGLSKNDRISWFFICLWRLLPAWDFATSTAMFDSLNTFFT